MFVDNYMDYHDKNNKNMRYTPLRSSFHSLEARQKDELNRNLLNHDLAESVFFEVTADDSELSVGRASHRTVLSSKPIHQNIFGKWVDFWVFLFL